MSPQERQRLRELMIRFADGDRAAFRPLFDGLWPVLLSVAGRFLAEPADAEDAAQRAMLRLFDQIVRLDRERDGVAWAATLAVYEAMTLRRRAQRRQDDSPLEVPAALAQAMDPEASPEALLLRADLREAVRASVSELPPRDREALADMLAERELEVGEAPRKRRTRAMARLRDLWRRAHG